MVKVIYDIFMLDKPTLTHSFLCSIPMRCFFSGFPTENPATFRPRKRVVPFGAFVDVGARPESCHDVSGTIGKP